MRAPRPDSRTDLLQILKATLATGVAWVVAAHVLELQQAFLAPWLALLTVHATVYRTVWRGSQAVLASGLGLVVSYVAVQLLGYDLVATPALVVSVLVGLLLARAFLARDEGVAVATTALFVITAGYGSHQAAEEMMLSHRFLDTLVGVATGLLVNLLVAPPLDDRVVDSATTDVTRRLGQLLVRMADDLRGDVDEGVSQEWLEATRDLDDSLDRAQQHLAFTRESRWANPLRHRSRRTADPDHAEAVIYRLEDGIAQARAVARIVHESVVAAEEWDPEFRRRWTDVLERVGQRVADPGRDTGGAPGLDDLVHDLSVADLPDRRWPLYGALITALDNVAGIADDVARLSGAAGWETA
ncbi:aromatic acid exporter family protein [uncultured Nocardioides sp.]|uniref:FUSC family protein n=1 Tax=uncultured Nocardioides sp. TaxID=198441 RepID=UPI00261E4C34|nr:aromatic acid exporter family protein [uncultured Nocardioides sp.]